MTRQEALELLPWHVAGTLSTAESQAVQTFIDNGEIDSGELAELKLFATEVGSVAATEPAYSARLLDDVLARLDETTQEASADRIERQSSTGPWARLLERFQWDATPVFARRAMGAQLVAMGGLVAVLALQLTVNPERPVPDVAYDTVSGPAVLSTADFSVAFAANTTEAELRRELQRLGLTIVSGPTALGLFGLAAADGADLVALERALTAAPIFTLVQAEAPR